MGERAGFPARRRLNGVDGAAPLAQGLGAPNSSRCAAPIEPQRKIESANAAANPTNIPPIQRPASGGLTNKYTPQAAKNAPTRAAVRYATTVRSRIDVFQGA